MSKGTYPRVSDSTLEHWLRFGWGFETQRHNAVLTDLQDARALIAKLTRERDNAVRNGWRFLTDDEYRRRAHDAVESTTLAFEEYARAVVEHDSGEEKRDTV